MIALGDSANLIDTLMASVPHSFSMQKVSLGTNVFVYPMPVALLGTVIDSKPNFMALGWLSRVNANPPLIGAGVGNHHHTPKGIRKHRAFSINVPSRDMMEKTDYCGLVSGKTEDKGHLFDVYYGTLPTAPLIRECPLSLECRLVNMVEMPTNTLYIGEIVASHTEERFLTDEKLDVKKVNPLLLTMPDNRYWTVGEYAGDAWKAGKGLKKN
ncbi:MAG: flr3 [Methanomicrobiales archaeon]|jgi:flavin reductase (DIM6/NTAB) family NADH-FMN oxidoreductase RutF|nr:flr3 [Methanomicrobiales archaeon]